MKIVVKPKAKAKVNNKKNYLSFLKSGKVIPLSFPKII